MRYNILHNLVIESTKKEVFKAVSLPEHLNNWWTLKCSGKPELGSEYNLFFTSEYDWYGKVSKCIEYESFHISMTKSDLDWDETTFGFDLEETDTGTLVKFSHINWPNSNNHFRTASFCWALLLNGLKNYIEKGIILPFEERS
jgi:uncharacterized protein YndB with AHSA1/START domain